MHSYNLRLRKTIQYKSTFKPKKALKQIPQPLFYTYKVSNQSTNKIVLDTPTIDGSYFVMWQYVKEEQSHHDNYNNSGVGHVIVKNDIVLNGQDKKSHLWHINLQASYLDYFKYPAKKSVVDFHSYVGYYSSLPIGELIISWIPIQNTCAPKAFHELFLQVNVLKHRVEILEELVDRPDAAGAKFGYDEICKILQ